MASAPAMKRINLLKGSPGPPLLPTDLLKQAAHASLSQPDIGRERGPLDYGDDEGYRPFRDNLARWLKSFYMPAYDLTGDNLCITGGASQNIACTLQVFADTGVTKHVWMVQPTYFLAVRMFEDAGFHDKLRAVPENEDGIDLDFFEKQLSGMQDVTPVRPTKPTRPYSKIYKHMLYCVPTFSNPSGKTMPPVTRERLVRLARKYDVLIICDDVYDFLQWSADPNEDASHLPWCAAVPRLIDVDSTLDGGPVNEWGNVLSNGSFSKIVAPGVRVGWAQGTPKLAYGLSQAGSSRSGGAPSQMTSTFINELIVNGHLNHHIAKRLLPSYSNRYWATIKAVEEELVPKGLEIVRPNPDIRVSGGYFVWLRITRPGLSAKALTQKALTKGLVLAGGGLFAVPGDDYAAGSLDYFLRICFAWEDVEGIRQGIKRLASML